MREIDAVNLPGRAIEILKYRSRRAPSKGSKAGYRMLVYPLFMILVKISRDSEVSVPYAHLSFVVN